MKVLLSQEELEAHCDATDSKDCPRGDSWDSNPWVWAYSFRRIER